MQKVKDAEVEQPQISPESKFSIDFSDTDNVFDTSGKESMVSAPKDVETLEKIAAINNEKRAQEDADDEKLNIGEDINLDIDSINLSDSILGNIEEL